MTKLCEAVRIHETVSCQIFNYKKMPLIPYAIVKYKINAIQNIIALSRRKLMNEGYLFMIMQHTYNTFIKKNN